MDNNVSGISGKKFIGQTGASAQQRPVVKGEVGTPLPQDQNDVNLNPRALAELGHKVVSSVPTPTAEVQSTMLRAIAPSVPTTITQLEEVSAVRAIGEGHAGTPHVTLGVVSAANPPHDTNQWYLNM